jgi:hypothetical protein
VAALTPAQELAEPGAVSLSLHGLGFSFLQAGRSWPSPSGRGRLQFLSLIDRSQQRRLITTKVVGQFCVADSLVLLGGRILRPQIILPLLLPHRLSRVV